MTEGVNCMLIFHHVPCKQKSVGLVIQHVDLSANTRVTVLSFPTYPHPGNSVALCARSPLQPCHPNSQTSITESLYQMTDMLHCLAGYCNRYSIECHPFELISWNHSFRVSLRVGILDKETKIQKTEPWLISGYRVKSLFGKLLYTVCWSNIVWLFSWSSRMT